MKNNAVPIKNIINNILSKHNPAEISVEENILQKWHQIMPVNAHKFTAPKSIKNKVLIIGVSNSAWLHQLTMQKKEILAKIKQIAGEEKIKNICFKITG